MKKIFNFIIISLSIIFLFTGCMGKIKELDSNWAKKNRVLQDKLGVKTYKDITKEKAINAMVFSFQKLNMIVESSDYKVGYMFAVAKAPSPLTYEEFEIVKNVEDGNARSYVPLFTWDALGDFDSKFNVSFLETGDGIQVSLRGRLVFNGDRSMLIPVTEFPPKAIEIAYPKIWNEFEKNLFIQRKTLK